MPLWVWYTGACVCFCMCVLYGAFIYACRCACLCMVVWRPESEIGYLLLCLFKLFFQTGFFIEPVINSGFFVGLAG